MIANTLVRCSCLSYNYKKIQNLYSTIVDDIHYERLCGASISCEQDPLNILLASRRVLRFGSITLATILALCTTYTLHHRRTDFSLISWTLWIPAFFSRTTFRLSTFALLLIITYQCLPYCYPSSKLHTFYLCACIWNQSKMTIF